MVAIGLARSRSMFFGQLDSKLNAHRLMCSKYGVELGTSSLSNLVGRSCEGLLDARVEASICLLLCFSHKNRTMSALLRTSLGLSHHVSSRSLFDSNL